MVRDHAQKYAFLVEELDSQALSLGELESVPWAGGAKCA